ncbi:hypothetical protein NKH18_17395 [Streptomyces sp. M10(2022)]
MRDGDLVGSHALALPPAPDGRGSLMFQDLQNHPFLTIGVLPSPVLLNTLDGLLESGSGVRGS